jgi:hypothetical protein
MGSPGIDDTLRNALIGSPRAVIALVEQLGSPPEVTKILRQYAAGLAGFETRVRALCHYEELRARGHNPPDARKELVRIFEWKPDYVATLVSGRGYQKEREEAKRRVTLAAEAYYSHGAVGNPTARSEAKDDGAL